MSDDEIPEHADFGIAPEEKVPLTLLKERRYSQYLGMLAKARIIGHRAKHLGNGAESTLPRETIEGLEPEAVANIEYNLRIIDSSFRIVYPDNTYEIIHFKDFKYYA